MARPLEDKKIAVALHYSMEDEEAPKVVAKGAGHLADKILEIAEASGVTIHQDADLAAVLSVVEVDCEIPVEAFNAVAEILSYIYKKNGSMKDRDKSRKTTS